MRFLLTLVLSSFIAATASAQLPGGNPPPTRPQTPIPTPGRPVAPGMLPSSVTEIAPKSPEVKTPYPEQLLNIDANTITVRSQSDQWLLTAGIHVLSSMGKDQKSATDARDAMRELAPTQWAMIGNTPLHYGLASGKATMVVKHSRASLPIDLKSVRAEAVRGVWVLKDDAMILVNFGLAQTDAEQAAAVVQKYGFNRLGMVGAPNPSFTYLFAEPVEAKQGEQAGGAANALQMANAEQNMNRTGIPVPGAGFVGERIVLDVRSLQIRKEKSEYILAQGSDVIGRFGPSEWSARDALKLIQDGRFTEYCRIGEFTFFLVNGKPPTRVPFSVTGRSFDPKTVKARSIDGRYGVYDGSGRPICSAATKEEAEGIVKVIQGYGFDTLCQQGISPRTALKFLAKTSPGK